MEENNEFDNFNNEFNDFDNDLNDFDFDLLENETTSSDSTLLNQNNQNNQNNSSLWLNSIEKSINELKLIIPIKLDINNIFTIENNNRYIIRQKQLKYFKIFPWFYIHNDKFRYKQTCYNINEIINSLNYFWENGFKFNENDEIFFREYYLKITNPLKFNKYLTKIVDLQMEHEKYRLATNVGSKYFLFYFENILFFYYLIFKKIIIIIIIIIIELQSTQDELIDVETIVEDHERRIGDLEEKIENLQVDSSTPGQKRTKRGGDRAGWLRIRDEDLPTRNEWCVEGGVFGF